MADMVTSGGVVVSGAQVPQPGPGALALSDAVVVSGAVSFSRSTPIIVGYGGAAVRADTLQLIGMNFGRVSSAALVDASGNQHEVEFYVDRGSSVHITIPKDLPDGTYIPILGDLDNVPSQNMAGPITLPTSDVFPPIPTPPADPIPDSASPATTMILQRLRLELGDFSENFQVSAQGDGMTRRFDLPVEVVSAAGLSVYLQPPYDSTESVQPPPVNQQPADFTMDYQAGVITMTTAPVDDSTLTVTGTHYQFYTDDELMLFLRSAALKHTNNSDSLQVYRDADGFKHFLYTNETVDGLRPVEYHLVALLAAVEALEVIRTDVAYDIDVTTAEGTSLPRSERFRNIGELMASKQTMYDSMAAALGVGLNKIEVFTLRRVSRTTGRLVPVYVDREYDDVLTPPIRVYAPRNPGVTGTGFDQIDPYAYGGTGVGGYP